MGYISNHIDTKLGKSRFAHCLHSIFTMDQMQYTELWALSILSYRTTANDVLPGARVQPIGRRSRQVFQDNGLLSKIVPLQLFVIRAAIETQTNKVDKNREWLDCCRRTIFKNLQSTQKKNCCPLEQWRAWAWARRPELKFNSLRVSTQYFLGLSLIWTSLTAGNSS